MSYNAAEMERMINARRKAKDDIVAAAREFVAKVDRGEARSVRSYGAFKKALAVLDGNNVGSS